MKSTKAQPAVDIGQPLAGGDVIDNLPASGRDPFEQLNDLMKVIEELCPKWPDRETFKDSDVFLL
jgi:hypothetical protein